MLYCSHPFVVFISKHVVTFTDCPHNPSRSISHFHTFFSPLSRALLLRQVTFHLTNQIWPLFGLFLYYSRQLVLIFMQMEITRVISKWRLPFISDRCNKIWKRDVTWPWSSHEPEGCTVSIWSPNWYDLYGLCRRSSAGSTAQRL